MNNLSTLLKRLEAATSRLEDIATSQAVSTNTSSSQAISGAIANQHDTPIVGNGDQGASSTSGAVAESVAAGAGTGTAIAGVKAAARPAEVPAVVAYGELISGPLKTYLSHCQEVGGIVAEQAHQVANTFDAQKAFIQIASACTKVSPSSPAYATILAPTQNSLMSVVDIKEKNRGSKEGNMLSTVSEGIGALGWVTLDSKPGPFVGEMKESAQFWANRVLKESKETNPKMVECSRSFIALLEELRKYVMQYHTVGLTWNPKGMDPETYAASPMLAAARGSPNTSNSPSSPSVDRTPQASSVSAMTTPKAADAGGIFAALNKGDAVTKGLKKVDKSEMTHKNPDLRASSIVPSNDEAKSIPTKPPKPSSVQKKNPVKSLEGNKWLIENYEGDSNVKIDQTEINQIVNIFNVKSSIIQIEGKVNAISLVNCSKTSVLVHSAVSSLSISSCPSFTVQIIGKVPTILIDGTDGGQVYLSRDSLDVEIITAKSSSINVSLPVEGEEEGVFEEKSVPEQLKTIIKSGKLVTTVVEHTG